MRNIIVKLQFLIFLFINIQLTIGQKWIPYGDDAILIQDSTEADQRFEIDGRNWGDCRYLTYFFINGTEHIDSTAEHDAVRRALYSWSAATNLDFIEACNEEDADIRFLWAVGAHGDRRPFDDNGNQFSNSLAHSFYPPPNAGALAGDVHFDDHENWRIDKPICCSDIDLETIALHELGHALGLRHSVVFPSVMRAGYEGPEQELYDDDKAGIRQIYGGERIEPISGLDIICNEADYILDDFDCLRANFYVEWSVSNNITILSGQGTGSIRVSTLADQEAGFIKASISSGCKQIDLTKNVWLGKPETPTVAMPDCFSPGSNETIRVISDGGTNFRWLLPDCPNGRPLPDSPDPDCWFNYDAENPSRSIKVYVGEQCNGNISVWVSNQCGGVSRNFPISCCSDEDTPGPGIIIRFGGGNDRGIFKYMNLYPMPANGLLTFELYDEYFKTTEEKVIELYSMISGYYSRQSFYKNTIEYDLSNLSSGQYFFTLTTDNYILGSSIILTK